MARTRKYEPLKLIAMFRLAAALRKQMLEVGFTDNGGAIHSAERILNILGLRLSYPELTHLNNLRNHQNAPFSEDALLAHRAGERVLIEHVSPHRALTRLAIEHLEAGMGEEKFIGFVETNFQLALLTEAETSRLNKLNRSKMAFDRLKSAGISLVNRGGDAESSTVRIAASAADGGESPTAVAFAPALDLPFVPSGGHRMENSSSADFATISNRSRNSQMNPTDMLAAQLQQT